MKSNKISSLTDEQLQKMKKEVRDALSLIRHSLLIKFPFTGNIAMRFDLIPIRDRRCPTALTDGKNIYFDMSFFSKLTNDERRFVLAHEIWHNVMCHFARRQNRNMMLFNIATDMEVNNILVDSSQRICMSAPEGLCFPPSDMKGKSAEVLYDWLLKDAKKNGKSGGNSSDSNSSASSKSDSKSEKKNGKLSGQFDKHKYSDDPDEKEGDEGNGDITDQWGEVGYDKDFNPSVSENAAEEMREAVVSAIQQCERTAGGLPGAVKSLLDKVLKPEVNWREELCSFTSRIIGDKRTWLPPNRRHVYNDMYFQSRRDDQLKVAVAVDTSGSCIGDLPKFFGELTGLLNSFGKYELTLIQNDYAVSRVDTFDQDNPFDPNDFTWQGGGGTSFKPPFDWIKEHNPDIDCFVFFTDGFEGFFDDSNCVNHDYDEPPYPVLWVITKDGNTNFCPWGKKIYFKESAYDY